MILDFSSSGEARIDNHHLDHNRITQFKTKDRILLALCIVLAYSLITPEWEYLTMLTFILGSGIFFDPGEM